MIVEVIDNGVHKGLTRCRWLWQMEPLRASMAEAQGNLADIRDEAHKDVTVANATGKETVEVMEAVDPNEKFLEGWMTWDKDAKDKKNVEVKGTVDLNHGVKDKGDPMAQRGEEPPVNQRGEVQEGMTELWNEEEYWEGRMTCDEKEYIPTGEPDGIGIPYDTKEGVPKGVCVYCGFNIPDGYDVKREGFEYCKRCCDNFVEGMKWM
jgi:hypothetical protein